MNQLSEAELQALEEMAPHEFHRVLMQIVAGGMTAWRHESGPRRNRVTPQTIRSSPSLPTAVARENLEVAETLV